MHAPNAVTIEPWNGVLFNRFLRYRDIVGPAGRSSGSMPRRASSTPLAARRQPGRSAQASTWTIGARSPR
jgi:hypothetical protein